MDVLDLLSNEEACSGLFRMVRWRSGVYCPRCGSIRVKGHGNYGLGLKRYMRKDCGRTFNKTGTVFHYFQVEPKRVVCAYAPIPGLAQLLSGPKLAHRP
ncbi:MAG: hypothetical protein DRO43_05200 [Candidatus Hecatellales archaeon]|nr:MAG: hypothetical protein DRO43_05200 [Candidatus Hecatellales archaeon]